MRDSLSYLICDPTESLTLENESRIVKREADKSYELGADRKRPDLAIEVVVTSGGIDKLEAYKPLKIPEVWFWEKSQLSLYGLRQEGYEQIGCSELLPELDIALFVRCMNIANHVEAVKEFRSACDRDLQSKRAIVNTLPLLWHGRPACEPSAVKNKIRLVAQKSLQ
ncbi:Uma2 family endonuclease [Microcoleus sp. A003_D6]|uniref:Uma2 family endonuclease n=1 Tax=Microcoleus sp. A003_D6 TaxID=3055266 RepID=UPI002FCFBFE5